MLQQPDVGTIEGLRDRAMLETFYATGMRRMEVVNLKLYDIDRERGTVMIRQGKGKKDRHIPIGERALAWIAKYVARSAAANCSRAADDGTVFLTQMGEPFDRKQLTSLVRRYLREIEDRQDGRLPSVPPHRGDADAGERRRYPGDSGAARAREADDHGTLHARVDQSAEAGLRCDASGREAVVRGTGQGSRRRRSGKLTPASFLAALAVSARSLSLPSLGVQWQQCADR